MTTSSSKHSGPIADHEAMARFVAAMVASAFRICPEAICDVRRGPAPVAFARQVAIYISHTQLGFSYATAGSIFGRDRTTAAYACQTVENKREDPTFDAILDYLERAVAVWPVTEQPQGIRL